MLPKIKIKGNFLGAGRCFPSSVEIKAAEKYNLVKFFIYLSHSSKPIITSTKGKVTFVHE
jgi:hypothetical protein